MQASTSRLRKNLSAFWFVCRSHVDVNIPHTPALSSHIKNSDDSSEAKMFDIYFQNLTVGIFAYSIDIVQCV